MSTKKIPMLILGNREPVFGLVVHMLNEAISYAEDRVKVELIGQPDKKDIILVTCDSDVDAEAIYEFVEGPLEIYDCGIEHDLKKGKSYLYISLSEVIQCFINGWEPVDATEVVYFNGDIVKKSE